MIVVGLPRTGDNMKNTRSDMIVLLEKEVRYARDTLIPIFKGNISWVRSYIEWVEEEYDVDVDPEEFFSAQTELENERARIKRAERVLSALALGEKNVTQRSILTAYTCLLEGHDRSNEAMNKIIQFYYKMKERYG